MIDNISFALLSKIATAYSRSIASKILREDFGYAYEQLISSSALRIAGNLEYIENPEDDGQSFVKVILKDSKFYRFCVASGLVEVPEDDLILYEIDVMWLINFLSELFGLKKGICRINKMTNHIWKLGDIKVGRGTYSLIFAMNIRKNEVFRNLDNMLKAEYKLKPAIVITTDLNVPDYYHIEGPSKLIVLNDVVKQVENKLTIDFSKIAGVMGEPQIPEGFSDGYYILNSKGKTYKFSKMQSAVMELLDKNGKMHKDEILAEIGSDQQDLNSIFRSRGKYHPAWNVIILNDRRGNYWVEW